MPAEEARQVIGIGSQAELLSELHKRIVSNSGSLLRLSLSSSKKRINPFRTTAAYGIGLERRY
jgi:hypothetical protein